MIGFILPFKPRSQSTNWDNDCLLLENTIASILNQTSDNYRIYLVHSDIPSLAVASDKISELHFPFDFQTYEELPDPGAFDPTSEKDKIIIGRRWDKSRKIFYGCKMALEDGCTYIMSVDTDDLVSKHLVDFIDYVTQNEALPGFFVDRGYLYHSGKKILLKVDKDMHGFNGSTHLIHRDYITIPDFQHIMWKDINLFTSHGWVVSRMKEEHGVDLLNVPFPAVTYVVHKGNISDIGQQSWSSVIKYMAKVILRGKLLTPELQQEFFINQRDDIG